MEFVGRENNCIQEVIVGSTVARTGGIFAETPPAPGGLPAVRPAGGRQDPGQPDRRRDAGPGPGHHPHTPCLGSNWGSADGGNFWPRVGTPNLGHF